MKIHMIAPKNFEPWDWRNSVEKGIGGSETSQVEMSWRLAQRGHEVFSYTWLPEDCPGTWRGTTWLPLEKADFAAPGLWIIYRAPAMLDNFNSWCPDQPRWLMCQDQFYPDMSLERLEKLDKVLPLCTDHAEFMAAKFPGIQHKLWMTSNGVKMDLIREVEKQNNISRNPKKLIYASSPDRGLLNLLHIFSKAREFEPELELHVFYGFDNIDKLIASNNRWALSTFAGLKEQILRLCEQPGVIWRGRVPQTELYQEWLSAGLWVYPTNFTETSCITCMEAQALGAIPITQPLWGLRDNVRWGVFIHGNPDMDQLVRARYAAEIVRWSDPENQERYRKPMMQWARQRYNWERWVDQWECEFLGLPQCLSQFVFQHKHMRGRTLNVGCGNDPFGFAARGAVNMDVQAFNPVNPERANAQHILHDARKAFPEALGKFDSIIVGDLLEHMNGEDICTVLRNCYAALVPKGQVIITVPNDGHRAPEDQHIGGVGNETYIDGISAFHTREISREDIEDKVKVAGFNIERYEPIDYTLFEGHGIVATKP